MISSLLSSIKNFFSFFFSFFEISKNMFGIITFGPRQTGKTTILRTLFENEEFSIAQERPTRRIPTVNEPPWIANLKNGKKARIQDMPGEALESYSRQKNQERELRLGDFVQERAANTTNQDNPNFNIDLLIFTLDPEILFEDQSQLDLTIDQMINCYNGIMEENPEAIVFICYTKFDEYDVGFRFSDKVFCAPSDKFTSYKTGSIFSDGYTPSLKTGIKDIDANSNEQDSSDVKVKKKDVLRRSWKLWYHLEKHAQRGLVNGYFVAAEPADNECSTENHKQIFRDFISLQVSDRPKNKLRLKRLITACFLAVLAIAPLSYFLKLHANDVSRYLQREIPHVPHHRVASLLGVDFSTVQAQKKLTASLLHTTITQCEKTECTSKGVIQNFKKKVKQENSNLVFSVTERTRSQIDKIIKIYNLSKQPIQNGKKISELFTKYQENPGWFSYAKEYDDSEKKNVLEHLFEVLCQELTKQKQQAKKTDDKKTDDKRVGSAEQNNRMKALLVEIIRGETYPFLFTKVLVSPKCNQLESLLQQAQELVLPLRLPAPKGTEISTQFSCAWEDSSKDTSVELETSRLSGKKCSLIKLSKQKISVAADFSLKKCQRIENIWIKKGNAQTIAVVASDKDGRRIERFSALLFALSVGNALRFYQKNENCAVLNQAYSTRLLSYLHQVYEFLSHQYVLKKCEKHESESTKQRCSRKLSFEENIQIHRYCKQKFGHIQNEARNCQTLLPICRTPRGGM